MLYWSGLYNTIYVLYFSGTAFPEQYVLLYRSGSIFWIVLSKTVHYTEQSGQDRHHTLYCNVQAGRGPIVYTVQARPDRHSKLYLPGRTGADSLCGTGQAGQAQNTVQAGPVQYTVQARPDRYSTLYS